MGRKRTIEEAVAEGLLIDVTEMAKKARLKHTTFASRRMVASFANIKGPTPEDALLSSLIFNKHLFEERVGAECYGSLRLGEELVIIEPHAEYGHVVLHLMADELEVLNLERMTGDRPEYSM